MIRFLKTCLHYGLSLPEKNAAINHSVNFKIFSINNSFLMGFDR